ncbi:hypothetical protein F4693_001671 [Sphingomonas endophytica]|uniref:Uncharacterized protein n=1 Tax=Sphingomonas endophytica TaxID=869719 RepID=A0A7X0MMV8_9SPHN|nr:hypothetical protein [Sphingomonas endophytica]
MTTAGVPDRERRPCIATQRVGLFGCGRLGGRSADAAATRLGRFAFLTCDRLGGGAERRREAISVECRRLFGGRRSLLTRLAGATATRRGVFLAGRDGHIGLRGNDLFGLLLLDIGRTVVALALAARAILTLTIFTGPIVALLRTLVAEALATPATLGLAGARLLLGADRIALVAEIVAVVELIEVVALAAHRLLVVRPAALVREDTEIMIRELQIIFSVDAITRHLRVAGHVLVFLEQLRGIAPRATVDPVAAVTLSMAAATLTLLLATTTAATATVLTVVDQFTVLVLEPKPAFAPDARVAIVPRRRDLFGNAGLPWPPDCSG